MYYVVDIEEDWYIKGSDDHYEMSYTGALDIVLSGSNHGSLDPLNHPVSIKSSHSSSLDEGVLDTAFRTQNKDTAFQVSDKCNEKGMETKVIIVNDKFQHIALTK